MSALDSKINDLTKDFADSASNVQQVNYWMKAFPIDQGNNAARLGGTARFGLTPIRHPKMG
jgi:hypothetical protein